MWTLIGPLTWLAGCSGTVEVEAPSPVEPVESPELRAVMAPLLPETSDRGPFSPRWSPDGAWLSVEQNADKGATAWLYAMNGTVAATPVAVRFPVVDAANRQVGVVWHPTSGLVFSGHMGTGNPPRLFMDPPPATAQELLNDAQIGGVLTQPAIAADGRTVAFVHDGAEVMVWTVGDARIRRVTAADGEAAPCLDADGTHVAWSAEGTPRAIQRIDLGSGSAQAVRATDRDQIRPACTSAGVIWYERRADGGADVVGESGVITEDVVLPIAGPPQVFEGWLVVAEADGRSIRLVKDGEVVVVETDQEGIRDVTLGRSGGKVIAAVVGNAGLGLIEVPIAR